jgi:hypothetical protein
LLWGNAFFHSSPDSAEKVALLACQALCYPTNTSRIQSAGGSWIPQQTSNQGKPILDETEKGCGRVCRADGSLDLERGGCRTNGKIYYLLDQAKRVNDLAIVNGLSSTWPLAATGNQISQTCEQKSL